MKLQKGDKIKYLVNKMRVVSMVPSWTETLIEAGADVVGRSRFCIHPSQKVTSIAAIGGTKEWNLEKLKALKPDLIVLDKEENTREMGGVTSWPAHLTHVQSVQDMPAELVRLASVTGLTPLSDYATRMNRVLGHVSVGVPQNIPGVLQWIRRPQSPIREIVYIIWKNPWMAVSQKTFIGSMLRRFVEPSILFDSDEKYPKITLENLNEESTLLLFSSEPFPFGKQVQEIAKLPFASALVDGEKWSWFGVRSLRFLEENFRI